MSAKARKNRRRKISPQGLLYVADRFKVLSEPARLKLLMALETGEHNVSALIKLTSLSQANVSKHLGILMRAGMIGRRKEGLKSFYYICDPQIMKLCDLMCAHLERDFAERAKHL